MAIEVSKPDKIKEDASQEELVLEVRKLVKALRRSLTVIEGILAGLEKELQETN